MPLSVYKTYETSAHRIIVLDNGVLHIYTKPTIVSREFAKELLEKVEEISEEPYYLVIEPTEEEFFSEDARKYVDQWMNSHKVVVAVIVKNEEVEEAFEYMSVELQATYKLGSFQNLEDAIAWIEEQRKKSANS